MAKKKRRRRGFTVERAFGGSLPLEEQRGTGDIDEQPSQKALTGTTTAPAPETTTATEPEEEEPNTEVSTTAVSPSGRTWPDLIHQLLTNSSALVYILIPFALFAIAIASGNLKNWVEVCIVGTVGLLLSVVTFFLKKKWLR